MAATKISPARLVANRQNAAKSTGPRTEAGKAQSRANALQHGLTGRGLAISGEDAARVEAEFLQAQEEFAPTTLAGMKLVRDVALIWLRQDRCRALEAAALDHRARHAAADFDRARQDHADRLIDAIETHPRNYRRALLLMPEGVDRLLDALAMLLGDLTAPVPTWSLAHHQRLDACLGFRVGDLPSYRSTRFSRAILGDYESIAATEVAHLEQADYQSWARVQLIAVIEAEIAHLIEHGAAIDRTRIDEDRAAAVRLARLDPGPDGALARRYESAAARDLSRALRDLHLVESHHGTDPDPDPIDEPDPIPAAEPDPTPDPIDPNPLPDQPVAATVGSFGEPTPAAAEPAPPVAPPAAEVAPAAPVHALRPVHTVEPTVFCTPMRQ